MGGCVGLYRLYRLYCRMYRCDEGVVRVCVIGFLGDECELKDKMAVKKNLAFRKKNGGAVIDFLCSAVCVCVCVSSSGMKWMKKERLCGNV